MTIQTKSPIGLDGVAAAETALSLVDGDKGALTVAGQPVGALAASSTFEDVAARLLSLATGTAYDAAEVAASLGKARVHAFERLPVLLPLFDGLRPIEAFRAAVAAMAPAAGLAPENVLIGAMPVLAAAIVRRQSGETPLPPDPALGHAADTLRMLRGEMPSQKEARALEIYLVTVSDHGMNASTFAGRVVASTQADLFMAVTAAYCALTGPLHGGAPEPVLEMLDAIQSEDRIAAWIDAALARGDRLMGFGHRIYRGRDPRADVLKAAISGLGTADMGLAGKVEAYARQALAKAKPDRVLDTNVEFYTAILLDGLGIPRQAFTPIFATGRVAGWVAHALEQQRKGRLLRPSAVYTGV